MPRAVRTALTVEMWECINGAWIELKRFEDRNRGRDCYSREEMSPFLDFVKKTSMEYDGTAYRTMLRNDAYCFSRVGLYVERADNTARILDVKYHVLLPRTEAVGGSLDYFQWTAILRAGIGPHGLSPGSIAAASSRVFVADLLILRSEMPRSLIAAYENICTYLDAIAKAYGQAGVAQKHARSMLTRLQKASTKENLRDRAARVHHGVRRKQQRQLSNTIGEQYLLT